MTGDWIWSPDDAELTFVWFVKLPFCGFEPTPPSAKQIPRAMSNPAAGIVNLEELSRSQRRSAVSAGVVKDPLLPSGADLKGDTPRSQEPTVKDTTRSLRRPLSDAANVCREKTGCQLPSQLQRRVLDPLLARRRSSCVRLRFRFQS